MTFIDRGAVVERVAAVIAGLPMHPDSKDIKIVADLVADAVEAEMRRQHGERVARGMARVRAEGKHTGRPALLTEQEIERLMDISADYSYAELAEMYLVSPTTIGRIIRERGP